MTRPALNKKNLLKLAANLYKDDGEYIHYVHLCTGRLAKSNADGITCCAIGEMYYHFAGEANLFESNRFQIGTVAATRHLASMAKVKDEYSLGRFAVGLAALVKVNDVNCSITEAASIQRAKRVQAKMVTLARHLQ